MSHPLVEIRFEDARVGIGRETVVRFWYHVPRVGDWIELGEGSGLNPGTVSLVMWGDDHVVVKIK